ncbi:transcription factor C6 like protein [Zymoseptoria brevis]|uniref:Transcription factor C6 like protein n=1 Tax=Zymoseptoria brevis TaxID=1047168 RepID=A0A0F4G7J9_9PEZI|nr:transcription factor C6 like protein [Zymoseptoria brevis]
MVKQPIFQVWADELWDQFGPLLTEGRPDQLRALSEQVWRNTRRPMEVNGKMCARDWARSSSGQNLRWEVVGCLMTLVGLVACSLSNWDGIFDQIRERYVDRATFSTRMRKASEFCLCFCYESEVLNDIYLCFIYEDLVLVELVKGDAHYASWQRLGEVCDAVVAMGLHQGNYPDAKTPFWLAEMRKKIFTSAYGHDKVLATFFGRPPRLSHRYCKMEPPLDLSDEQLLSEGEELRLAMENLDADGWNTSGHLHRITWGRVLFYHNRLREDILEIALGSGEEDIVSQADRVRAKIDRINDPIPDFMKVTPERFFNASIPLREHAFPTGSQEKGPRQIDVVIMLCFQTGMAHTEFLLQRALVCRLKTDSKQLIPVSRRMLQLTLLAHSKRELFRDFQADLIYLLALHGLPAAGVLAVELLKQEQTKQYTPALLPRSETVQDLSVFISALAAVGPGEGNFSICDQGRRALKKVLDQILSPTMTAPPMPMPDGLAASVDEGGWGFPIGNDADFLSWLDNVEWDKRDWGEPALVNGVVNGL